ncbi:MAG: DUF3873 family protein [Bacteroidales bacterium]|nr:DUF3873 family protein [Bacteroidales bacterium]
MWFRVVLFLSVKFVNSERHGGSRLRRFCRPTTTPGTEQYEVFYIGFRPQRKRYLFHYRHTDGELFSRVAPTLTECHRKRDE